MSSQTRITFSRYSSLCAITAVLAAGTGGGTANANPVEPNAEIASLWWPPQRNVWTPIGWKDHFFRFNVIYNGTVMATPPLSYKDSSKPWRGQGVQLDFTTSDTGRLPAQRADVYYLHKEPDNGVGKQGWRKNPTPVLWTEWPGSQSPTTRRGGSTRPPEGSGIVLRQDIFAHIPGAKDIETGIEPLFAWIRLSVKEVHELDAPTNFNFFVHISAPHLDTTMDQEKNMRVTPAKAGYPRLLTAENSEGNAKSALHLLEPDGRVRMVALPSDDAQYTFQEAPAPVTNTYYLRVTLPARVGAHADILLPLIPTSRDEMEKELALGFEGALKESDRYWSKIPETAAKFETPERQINEAIAWSLKFAELIAERNPETGHY